MTMINWLLLIELLACLGLLIWLFRRAHHHAKKSPATEALEQHLAELEAEKAQRAALRDQTPNKSVQKKTKVEKSV